MTLPQIFNIKLQLLTVHTLFIYLFTYYCASWLRLCNILYYLWSIWRL